MGACQSFEIEHDDSSVNMGASEEEERISRNIDRQLKADAKEWNRQVKLLLLGAGESGKSKLVSIDQDITLTWPSAVPATVLKQMKIIHLDGFQPHEVDHYRQQIFDNLCDAIRRCIEVMDELEIPLDAVNERYLVEFEDMQSELLDDEPYPAQFLPIFKNLWADTGLRKALKKQNEYAIPENIHYFFPELDRLFKHDYTPTHQDILRARGKTTGITETAFVARNMTYRLFDVGGQRSERKKWIHCFENVTAVIFLAAISGYDQCLLEDPDSVRLIKNSHIMSLIDVRQNVMHEALMLFDSICNSKWFLRTSIILFLNKTDLFQQRILVSDIRTYFPDYTGSPTDPVAARKFFRDEFVKLNRSREKEVYIHYTCAVDTKAFRVVMAALQDILLSQNLNSVLL